jgi:DNA-binding transcriptional LysR family regulator
MGFEGVVVSDALDMAAISANFTDEDTLRLTINAGVDMLILPIIKDTNQFERNKRMVDLAVDMVKRGEIDVAFMSKVGDDSRINYRLCGKQPIVLCVNSKHPWAHLQSVPVDKLDGRTVLTYEDANPAAPAVKRALSSRGVTLQNAFLDEMTMASLVQVDMQSIAVFCYSLVVEAIDGIAIIRIDGLSERMCNDVYFAYAKTSQRAVSAGFIEHVLKCLEARESLLPEP